MKMNKKKITFFVVFLVCIFFTSITWCKYTTTLSKTVTLNITNTAAVAEVNGEFYDSLQEAVDAVPTDGTQTTVTLLTDVEEYIVVDAGKNIVFDLQNFTVSYVVSRATSNDNAVIENKGTIKITNGTIIAAEGSTISAINNNKNAVITISGGNIISNGSKQAFYNAGGTATIEGNPYFKAISSNRSTVHNYSGTMYITGGTIESVNYYAFYAQAGTVKIGVNDSAYNPDAVTFKGKTYGIYGSVNYDFFDGTAMGKTAGVNDLAKVHRVETGYYPHTSQRLVDGVTYKIFDLAVGVGVTFDANGGSPTTVRSFEVGSVLGTLPVPERNAWDFVGWFTERNGGTQIDGTEVINEDVTFYAHWVQLPVAVYNNVTYNSIQDAIAAVPANNTESTITLIRNARENITIPVSKYINIDFAGFELSNSVTNAVIVNNGTFKMTNGTIRQAGSYAAINNNDKAKLFITGGSIISTGQRAAIYNLERGMVEISGNPYFESNASGTMQLANVTIERAAIMNVSDQGTITITGGTILSKEGYGISNYGTLNLGVKQDGVISNSNPSVTSATYAIKNFSTFNYYDGILKGKTGTISGSITERESNTVLNEATEIIDGDTYHTVFLSQQGN